MTTIKTLIKECNFGYIANYVKDLLPEYDGTPAIPEIHHFNRYISTEDILKEFDKLGYRAGTLSELLAYQKANPEDENWIVALGTQFSLGGDLQSPYLSSSGGGRGLNAGSVSDDWSVHFRFLFVRKPLDISNSASALEQQIINVINAGYSVSKNI